MKTRYPLLAVLFAALFGACWMPDDDITPDPPSDLPTDIPIVLPLDKVPEGVGGWSSAAFVYRALTEQEREAATKTFKEAYARALLLGFDPGAEDGPLGGDSANFAVSFQGPDALMQKMQNGSSAIAWSLLAPKAYWVPPEIAEHYEEMDMADEPLPRGVPISDAVRERDGTITQRFSFGFFRVAGETKEWIPDSSFSIAARTKFLRGVFGPTYAQVFEIKPGDVVRYTLDRSEPGASSALVPAGGVPLSPGFNLIRTRMWAAGSTSPSPILTIPVWFEQLVGGERVPDGDLSEGSMFYGQVKNTAQLAYSLSFPEGAMKLDPGGLVQDPAGIQIGTPDTRFLVDTYYVLRFKAKADAPRFLTARMFERGANGDSDGDGKLWEPWGFYDVALTSEFQQFSVVFLVPKHSASTQVVGALTFMAGAYREAIYLDDLSILPYGAAPVSGSISVGSAVPRLTARAGDGYSSSLYFNGTSNYIEAVLDVPATGVTTLDWQYVDESYPEVLVSVFPAANRQTALIPATDTRPVDLSSLEPGGRYYFRVECKDGLIDEGKVDLLIREGSAQ